MTKLLLFIRAASVAMLLAFGVVAVAPVAAQDTTPAVQEVDDTADGVVAQTEDAVTDDEGGFQWGLLGLLGLAGLAGLMRRPEPTTTGVDAANRPVTRVDDRDGTTI